MRKMPGTAFKWWPNLKYEMIPVICTYALQLKQYYLQNMRMAKEKAYVLYII